jgi:hypothetical protein
MGLMAIFSDIPIPPVDIADNSLAAFRDIDALDNNALIALAAITLEGFQLGCERPSKLVKRTLGAVVLRQSIHTLQASGHLHGCVMDRSHLDGKHRLQLVTRFDFATPSWHGKPLYQSYLIAASGRPVDDWTGLKGDIHAFSDPDSNSGFLVTRALLAENRLLHGGFFSGRELPKAG